MIYTPRIRISPPEIFLKNICFSNQYFHVCRGSNIVVGYEEELAEDADTSNSSLCRPKKETNRRIGLICQCRISQEAKKIKQVALPQLCIVTDRSCVVKQKYHLPN